MGCLKLENHKYEGKIIKMSKDKDRKKEFKKLIVNMLCLIIPAYLGWLGLEIVSLGKEVRENSTNINKIDNLESKIDNLDVGLNGKDGIYSRLAVIEEKIDIPTITASDDTQKSIDAVSVVNNKISVSASPISSDTCIGTDSDGNTYIAKDLINETILLTFIQDDKEIYFLGQYNENFHWDGYCVTNTYNSDGTLFGICESDFDDGERLDYKSFYMAEAENEWIYTDRKCQKDSNEGVSIRYKFAYDKNKNFTNTNVRISDILYVKDFEDNESKQILSCYNGLTADGLYNDDTGNAYLVLYSEDGFVKTFYKGKFKDGYFEDDNAFEIVFDGSGNINRYFLYEGGFTGGKRESDEGIRYITQEEIHEIMEENGCPKDLQWYEKN